MLRDHGQAKKYYHDMEGYNGRLDSIQAAILRVKLQHLAQWNEQRRKRASVYAELAEHSAHIVLPSPAPWAKPVYHLYVIRVEDRDGFMAKLAAHNIGTGIHYPIPLHLQKAFSHLGYQQGDFPVAERLAKGIVSLPMFPTLTDTEQKQICETVGQMLGHPALVS
jgi:dTDP-4-amino-4,6-dideoxygalactose transaminase